MEIVVIFSAEVEEPFFNVVFMLCSKCMMTYIWFGCKNTAAHISAKWNCVCKLKSNILLAIVQSYTLRRMSVL